MVSFFADNRVVASLDLMSAPALWQTPEVREVTTLLSVKRSPHQKPIKMKRQRTIIQIREQEKIPEKSGDHQSPGKRL